MLWHKRVCWSEETCVLKLPNWGCFDLCLSTVSFSAMCLGSCTSCAALQFPHPFLTPNPDPLLPWHPQEARQQITVILLCSFQGLKVACAFLMEFVTFSFESAILSEMSPSVCPDPSLQSEGLFFFFMTVLSHFWVLQKFEQKMHTKYRCGGKSCTFTVDQDISLISACLHCLGSFYA